MNGLDRQSHSFLRFVFLMVLCGILYLPPLYRIPFFDKGEPREALEVQSLVTGGNWLFPLKTGGDIPSKPPLFHWAGALFSLIWGETNEATVRFPSAFFATLGVLMLYLFGRKLFDTRVAFLAGVILATTLIYQKQAVEARVDMTLSFFVAATLIIFYALYQGWLPTSLGFYGFYLILGVSVLAKGPVGLVLPGTTVAIFLVVRKRWDFFAKLCFHKGVLLALGVGLLWYGIALFQGGEAFFGRQILKENLARFFVYGEGGTGHQKPIYYYLPYLFSGGLPWSLFLPFIIIDGLKNKSFFEEGSLFLVLWSVVVFGFFSLAAGKRADYLLPLYPALALLTARWIRTEREFAIGKRIGLSLVAGLCLLSGAVLAAVFFWILWDPNLLHLPSGLARLLKPKDELKLLLLETTFKQPGWVFLSCLGGAILLWLLAAWDFFQLRVRRAALKLSMISILSWLLAEGIFMQAIADARSYRNFMKEVNRVVAQGGNLYLYGGGFDSSSVFFYHGGVIPDLNESPLAVTDRLRSGKDRIIMSEQGWKQIQSLDEHLSLRVIKSVGTGPEGDAPLVLVSAVAEPNL